ncbi:MAG TPA: ferrochelatase, partial [Acidimicrobiales bacterium]|nr:ferrochelatase [Acidimicrobiales bacterium]
PPPPDLLAELEGRYRAIGGLSPLTGITRSQVTGIAAALEARAPGRYRVAYGAKHTEPRIETGMAELREEGIRRVVALVLTPHQSSPGSEAYLERVAAAASEADGDPVADGGRVDVVAVRSWHRAPGFAELLAERTEQTVEHLDPSARRRVTVLFTAHSVPQRALLPDDPYPRQVAESAADVAGRIGLDPTPGPSWGVAWQSAGRTPEPWLGPDLSGEIARAGRAGATAVVVCPVGFVADHLEILYDLDIEAAGVARSNGVVFARTPSLNDDPRFCDLLAGVVESAAGDAGVAEPAGPRPATSRTPGGDG